MPTYHDAPGLWIIAGLLGACIGLCVAFGRAPTRSYGWLRRSEHPGAFWLAMGVAGVGLFVLVFLALYATIRWP